MPKDSKKNDATHLHIHRNTFSIHKIINWIESKVYFCITLLCFHISFYAPVLWIIFKCSAYRVLFALHLLPMNILLFCMLSHISYIVFLFLSFIHSHCIYWIYNSLICVHLCNLKRCSYLLLLSLLLFFLFRFFLSLFYIL